MIVQPNFLDHWKTNALAAKIGRQEALTALLALWSHCQNQRTWQFPHNELMLAGICRYTGNPRVLVDTLLELNLLEKTPENDLEVHQWAETNAKLLHNWDAGKKGGRPAKQPKDKPTENPRVNPTKTQGEPKAEPIREDKRRKENTPLIPQGGDIDPSASPAPQQTDSLELQHDESEATASPQKKEGGRAALAEQIYALYPRKVGKTSALRAIERILKAGKVPPEDLLVTVRNYARATATWPAGDEVFIPHPATWFNSGRYDDDPREWLRGPSDLNPEPPTYLPSTYDGPAGWRDIMDELYTGLDWRAAYPTWQATEPGDREKIKARLLQNA
jgi:hypothetical protein